MERYYTAQISSSDDTSKHFTFLVNSTCNRFHSPPETFTLSTLFVVYFLLSNFLFRQSVPVKSYIIILSFFIYE